jgi:hypothetical protein
MNRDARYGGARTRYVEDQSRVVKKLRTEVMGYAVDDGQLLNIWMALRYLGKVREIADPASRSEVLTEAQALLTAFVLMLKPLPADKARSSVRAGLDQVTMFDAE